MADSCVKCGGEVDTGMVSWPDGVNYTSDSETGMRRRFTSAKRARACLSCGYFELYADPGELRRNSGR